MFITLKSLLSALLLPPTGPLLLAAAGAALIGLCAGARARRAGWALLIAGLATLWVLATPMVANALTEAAQPYPALDLAHPLPAQAIVVLGGGEARAGAPEYAGAPAAGGDLLERVEYAAFIARRTALPILVTGQARETLAMRAALVRDFGIEPRWVEDRSRDTYQNAQFSAPMLKAAGVRRIVLVTSAVHERRAVQEFTSAGFGVVPAPEGMLAAQGGGLRRFLPNGAALVRSTAALHELLGEVARRLFAALGVRRQRP
jgi:uncharacterized SAM-binding protein YcdF (DUF218 family)